MSGLKPRRIPDDKIYHQLTNELRMRLPVVAKAGDDASAASPESLHYVRFPAVMEHPFTTAHQPSLQLRAASRAARGTIPRSTAKSRTPALPRNAQPVVSYEGSNSSLHQQGNVRGVVECKDCQKPRIIY